ncbi:protein of unknown function [Hyphomicrobium sp. 1Nfss2.1]
MLAAPSMVVMSAPSSVSIGETHERRGSPFTCTVQAPHWAMPQPNFVPVRSCSSRRNQSSGIDGSPSNSTGLPLTVSLIIWRLAELGVGWVQTDGEYLTDNVGSVRGGSLALQKTQNRRAHCSPSSKDVCAPA